MDVARCNKCMNIGPICALDRLPSRVNIALYGARKAANKRIANYPCNLANRVKIAGRRSGKACLDHVYAHAF